jgi:hypothetical protein
MKKALLTFFICCMTVSAAFVQASQLSPILAAVTDGPTDQNFDEFNPLKVFNQSEGESYYVNPEELNTPAGIMSRVLVFAFPIAGLVLFVMLIWGGFEMLSGAATKKSLDAGRQRITAALVGFLLLFASYWIAQVLEVVFGVVIL